MRFLALLGLFVVAIGYFLQSGTDLPYLEWMGVLPGDLLIRKGAITICLPLTTALIFSVLLSFVLSAFSKN